VFLTLQPPRLFFWLRTANRELAKASFAGIVALLVRSNVPLPKALPLAFQAVGAKNQDNSPLPHLVRWMQQVPNEAVLLSGLQQYSETAVFRAQNRLERIKQCLPMIVMLALGCFVFVLYFVTIVFPYGCLLWQAAGV
jgi:type II secretory pathway component PulF